MWRFCTDLLLHRTQCRVHLQGHREPQPAGVKLCRRAGEEGYGAHGKTVGIAVAAIDSIRSRARLLSFRTAISTHEPPAFSRSSVRGPE